MENVSKKGNDRTKKGLIPDKEIDLEGEKWAQSSKIKSSGFDNNKKEDYT